ncbi:hypothetical protein Tco_0108660, partial [Tanacetum coccineum]
MLLLTTTQTQSAIVFASSGSNNRHAHPATRRTYCNGAVNRTHVADSSRGSDSRHHPRQ